MTDQELLKRSKNLQNEAHEVLNNLGLIEILSSVGRPVIMGSVELDLMTWRDIDIHVISENISLQNVLDVTCKLISADDVRKIELQDNRNHRVNKHHPDGFYLSIRYRKENQWKIDVWFENTSLENVYAYTKSIKEKLTDQNRKNILYLKTQVADNPKYRYTIFSTDVYDAVISYEVKNVDDFEKYLNKTGRSLK